MRNSPLLVPIIITLLTLVGLAVAEVKLTGDVRCLVVKCVVIKQ